MSYIILILRGRWCHFIVLNIHVPTEDKINYVKDSFYKEVEGVFNAFPKYQMKILLADLNAKEGKKAFSNQQFGMRVYAKLVLIMESQ
jgi:hypothetical protein